MNAQTDGMTSDNTPAQEEREVTSDRCKKCGRKGIDMRCGICGECAFPNKDIMTSRSALDHYRRGEGG